MCLIIHKPANVVIPAWITKSALISNPDGLGIACNGTRERYAEISEQRALARLNRPDEALVHFRWATAGITSKGNTHPFALSDGSLLMHNGILPAKYQPKLGLKAGENDTRVFIRTFLEPAIEQGGGVWPHIAHVEREIAGDKLAVMSRDAKVTLYNETNWVEWEGLKLSNTYAWDAPDALCPERVYMRAMRKYLVPAESDATWYDSRGRGALYAPSVDDAPRNIMSEDATDDDMAQWAHNDDTALTLFESITDTIIEREDDVDWRSALFLVDLDDSHLIDGIIDAKLTVFDFCRAASANSLLEVYRDLASKGCV